MQELISILMMSAGVGILYIAVRVVLKGILEKSLDIRCKELWKGLDRIVIGAIIVFIMWMSLFQFPYIPQESIKMPTAPDPEPTQVREVRQPDTTNEARKDADAALMQATQLFSN